MKNPDPPNPEPLSSRAATGTPAPGPSHDRSGAGHTTACWLCGRPIQDPPEVIGQYIAGQQKVAHRRCWQTLGEHELELRPPAV